MEKKRSVGVILLILLFALSFTSCKQRELSKEEIIQIATVKAKGLGFNIEEMDILYDEENRALKEHLLRKGVSIYNRETKEWIPASSTTPEEEYPLLTGRNYQAVYFGPKVMMKGGDLWIFIDKNTGEVITYIRGK